MSECVLNMLPVKEEEKALFESLLPDAIHLYAGRRTVTPEQLGQATIIMGWPRAKDLAHCRNLKWLHSMWAGTDEYTAPGVLPAGTALTSSAGFNCQSVAEHSLAMALSLCRKLPQCRDNQLQRSWTEMGSMKTLMGATVLVVGAGNIGAAFAGRCRALGSRTIGLKRTVSGAVAGFDQLYTMDELDRLLPQADVVALFLPHSPATVKLINARRLGLMKQDAILINAGRGTAVDHDALAQALLSGHLWGAGLDVTDPEPLPPEHPLWAVDNLLLTPHTAGGIRLELNRKNCIDMALDNLRRYLGGQALGNRVL